jgi:hypothetical protein
MEPEGDLGFRAAAETADVEIVLVSSALDHGASWGLIDTLTNLKGDARTSNIPVFIYGPHRLEIDRPNLPLDFPGVKLLVQPTSPELLEKELGGRPAKFTSSERVQHAQEAAMLLARISQQPHSPLAANLTAAEPALLTALSQPGTSMAASTALGDVPTSSAQRSLADVALDPSRPAELRRNGADHLARSIKRFGPLVSADQEAKLAIEGASEAEPQIRSSLGTVVEALRSWAGPRRKTSPTVRPLGSDAAARRPAGPAMNPR